MCTFCYLLSRCPADIFGINIQTGKCQEESCATQHCQFDPDTGLYEQGCTFLPDTSQFMRESIMYSQALTDVSIQPLSLLNGSQNSLVLKMHC